MSGFPFDDNTQADDGIGLLRLRDGRTEERNFKGTEDGVRRNILVWNSGSEQGVASRGNHDRHLFGVEGGVDDGDAPVRVCAEIEGV